MLATVGLCSDRTCIVVLFWESHPRKMRGYFDEMSMLVQPGRAKPPSREPQEGGGR